MKGKKLLAFALAALIAIGGFSIFAGEEETYYTASAGILGGFKIDGKQAYCYDHSYQAPNDTHGEGNDPLFTKHNYLDGNVGTDELIYTKKNNVASLLYAGFGVDSHGIFEKERYEGIAQRYNQKISDMMGPEAHAYSWEDVASMVTQFALWSLLDPSFEKICENSMDYVDVEAKKDFQELVVIGKEGDNLEGAVSFNDETPVLTFDKEKGCYTSPLLVASGTMNGTFTFKDLPENMQIVDETGAQINGAIALGQKFYIISLVERGEVELHADYVYETPHLLFYKWVEGTGELHYGYKAFQNLVAVEPTIGTSVKEIVVTVNKNVPEPTPKPEPGPEPEPTPTPTPPDDIIDIPEDDIPLDNGEAVSPVEPSRPSGGTADGGDGLIYIDDDEIPLTGDKGNFLAAGACMVLAAGVVIAATSIKRKKK